jgi:hypothetical protein
VPLGSIRPGAVPAGLQKRGSAAAAPYLLDDRFRAPSNSMRTSLSWFSGFLTQKKLALSLRGRVKRSQTSEEDPCMHRYDEFNIIYIMRIEQECSGARRTA